MSEIHGQSAGYELALEQLLEIFTSTSRSVEERIHAVLESCAKYLGMPCGQIGEIVGKEYVFRACLGLATGLKLGAQTPLAEFLNGPTGQLLAPVIKSSPTEILEADHVIQLVDGFQCFVGVPLRIDDEIVGALIVNGQETDKSQLVRREIKLMQLAANWIGLQLGFRREKEKRCLTIKQNRGNFRNSSVMALKIDKQGSLTDASDKWLEMMGYQRHEVIGQPIAGFVSLEDKRQILNRTLPELWREGVAAQCPCRLVSKSGQIFDYECSSIASKNEQGEYDNAKTIIIDVSERNQFQAELAVKNGELALANEQLRQFAYVASHDLREPLRKISIFGKTLSSELGDDLSEDAHYSLDTMISAAARLSDLVSDVLVLSKETYSEITLEEVNLEELMQEILVDLEPVIKEKLANISVGTLPVVNGDKQQLLRMFLNILNNALKYHLEGAPPVVDVSCEMDLEGEKEGFGSSAVILITDFGIGFDNTSADEIFQAFHRLNPRGVYGGSGIGLAIVKTIAERHKWKVSATGKKGEGAVFRVRLPMSAVCANLTGEVERKHSAI